MKLRNVFKVLLVLVFSFSFANALTQSEIQSTMTKKIDTVLSILEKKDLTFPQKGEKIIKIIFVNFCFN